MVAIDSPTGVTRPVPCLRLSKARVHIHTADLTRCAQADKTLKMHNLSVADTEALQRVQGFAAR